MLPLEPSRGDYFSSVVFVPLVLEESWCSARIAWLLKVLSPILSPGITSFDSHNKSFHSIHFIVAAMWEGGHSPSFLKDFSSCFVATLSSFSLDLSFGDFRTFYMVFPMPGFSVPDLLSCNAICQPPILMSYSRSCHHQQRLHFKFTPPNFTLLPPICPHQSF